MKVTVFRTQIIRKWSQFCVEVIYVIHAPTHTRSPLIRILSNSRDDIVPMDLDTIFSHPCLWLSFNSIEPFSAETACVRIQLAISFARLDARCCSPSKQINNIPLMKRHRHRSHIASHTASHHLYFHDVELSHSTLMAHYIQSKLHLFTSVVAFRIVRRCTTTTTTTATTMKIHRARRR